MAELEEFVEILGVSYRRQEIEYWEQTYGGRLVINGDLNKMLLDAISVREKAAQGGASPVPVVPIIRLTTEPLVDFIAHRTSVNVALPIPLAPKITHYIFFACPRKVAVQ